MTLETLQDILQWSAVINIGLIIVWAFMIMAAGNFIYRLHNRVFPMSREHFSVIHYGGILLYKLLIFLFNLIPLLAIYIIQ